MSDKPKKEIKENKGWKNLIPAKPGEVRNPKGRPKGLRNKFSETFLADFLKDWEEHGADAITTVRKEDPTNYLKVAASLVPKEFTITEGETSLERVLEQLTDSELEEAIAGIQLLGGTALKGKAKAASTDKPDRVH